MNPKIILKLLFASLVVGIIMSSLGLTPGEFWSGLADLFAGSWEWVTGSFEGFLGYMVIGAMVVVPIYVVRTIWRAVQGRTPAAQRAKDADAE